MMTNPSPWSGPPSVTVPAGQKFSIRFQDYPDADLEISFDPETEQAVMNFPLVGVPIRKGFKIRWC